MSDDELNRLIEVAESGAADGAQWLQLADHFNRFERVFLREADWTALCRRLVTELGSAVGTGYVRRYEAAAAFIRHPNARRHLIMAVGRFVTDPDTQVVAPVLNLLSEVPDPAAAALTLRMLSADSDNKYLRRAASSVAAVKLARGHFDEAALPRLESHVVGALRRGESLDGRLDSFDLAVRLPDSSWERVTGGLRTRRAHALVERRPARATSWSRPPGPRRRRRPRARDPGGHPDPPAPGARPDAAAAAARGALPLAQAAAAPRGAADRGVAVRRGDRASLPAASPPTPTTCSRPERGRC